MYVYRKADLIYLSILLLFIIKEIHLSKILKQKKEFYTFCMPHLEIINQNNKLYFQATYKSNPDCQVEKIVPTYIIKGGGDVEYYVRSGFGHVHTGSHDMIMHGNFQVHSLHDCLKTCYNDYQCLAIQYHKRNGTPSCSWYQLKNDKKSIGMHFQCSLGNTCIIMKSSSNKTLIEKVSDWKAPICVFVTGVTGTNEIYYGRSNVVCENIHRTKKPNLTLIENTFHREHSILNWDRNYDKISIMYSGDFFQTVEILKISTATFRGKLILTLHDKSSSHSLSEDVFINNRESCHEICHYIDKCRYYRYENYKCDIYERCDNCTQIGCHNSQNSDSFCGKILGNVSRFNGSDFTTGSSFQLCFQVSVKEGVKAPSEYSDVVCNPNLAVNKHKKRGDDESLICFVPNVDSLKNSKFIVQWTLNNVSIEHFNEGFQLSNDGLELTLKNTNTSHTGLYECKIYLTDTLVITGKGFNFEFQTIQPTTQPEPTYLPLTVGNPHLKFDYSLIASLIAVLCGAILLFSILYHFLF